MNIRLTPTRRKSGEPRNSKAGRIASRNRLSWYCRVLAASAFFDSRGLLDWMCHKLSSSLERTFVIVVATWENLPNVRVELPGFSLRKVASKSANNVGVRTSRENKVLICSGASRQASRIEVSSRESSCLYCGDWPRDSIALDKAIIVR